jgi:hypothetical protein
MSAAGLNPQHVAALIVYIDSANPDKPRFLSIEEEGKTPDECRGAAFEKLGDDAIALGMIFRQFDERSKQQTAFPYQFVGLNERGVGVLRGAAAAQVAVAEMMKGIN